MSSQFQEEWSAVAARFFMEIVGVSTSERRNLVFGPRTLTTGWRPIVLVTTPPQPASKARRMFDSDSVGGAEERRKGFSKRIPVNSTERSAVMVFPLCSGKHGFYACADSRPARRVRTVVSYFSLFTERRLEAVGVSLVRHAAARPLQDPAGRRSGHSGTGSESRRLCRGQCPRTGPHAGNAAGFGARSVTLVPL